MGNSSKKRRKNVTPNLLFSFKNNTKTERRKTISVHKIFSTIRTKIRFLASSRSSNSHFLIIIKTQWSLKRRTHQKNQNTYS